MSTNNPWKTLHTEVKYDNPWITVNKSDVITPGGSPGEYGIVHFKNLAIGVVPIDNEGNTWLIGQYRLPLERYTWEIVEGGAISKKKGQTFVCPFLFLYIFHIQMYF